MEQLQWIVQPGIMSKLQEDKRKKANKIEKVTGVSQGNIVLDNILDKKLAKHGLTQKDLIDGR